MRATTFSKGIYKLPYLKQFLGLEKLNLARVGSSPQATDLILGWGKKKNTTTAVNTAKTHNLPYATLEDGFIRSMGLGRAGNTGISLVVDDVGIYYDSSRPSALENILNGADSCFTEDLMQDARAAMAQILEHTVSKYNGQPPAPSDLFKTEKKNILIIDQVAGDASITFGTDRSSLQVIVATAKRENPDAQVFIKLHPETIAGFRKGLFSDVSNDPDLILIKQDYNPLSVLKHVDKVYVATSQMGFEALLMGKEVVCFGMPFYAGWGLTDDRVNCSRRVKKRTLEQVFAAAYILYSRYVNPVTGAQCDIFEAIDYIVQQLKMEELNRSDVFCFGIRHWTRYNIRPFLKSQHNRIHFIKTAYQAKKAGIKKGDQIIVWGTRQPEGLEQLVSITGKPPLCMEDGFLRSVGLGSDFARPSSLVLDPEGIYFDPFQPSRLENILTRTQFNQSLLDQAEAVRNKIILARLTKYNHESHLHVSLSIAQGTATILVPGQVEDDASIRLGCESVNTNLGLLKAVRENNPSGYIIYKPHPDVSSGNRIGKVHSADALRYCDEIIESVSIPSCLESVDEVHTMTSLVGFEALMRELPVTVYGKPFYAGWGLTTDKLSIERRTRQLNLSQLVAGTLLLYPRYYDWDSESFTNCESTIDKLVASRDAAEKKKGFGRLQVSYAERQLKKLTMMAKGISHAR